MSARPNIARFRVLSRLIWTSVIAPTLDDCVADRLDVGHQCPREVDDCRNAAVPGVVAPSVKLRFVMVSQQALKADGQITYRGKARNFLLQDREYSDLALA